MSEVILSKEDLTNINIRANIIQQKQIELQIIMREKELFHKELLTKYNLESSKKYDIDARGVITEIQNADNKRIKIGEGETDTTSTQGSP